MFEIASIWYCVACRSVYSQVNSSLVNGGTLRGSLFWFAEPQCLLMRVATMMSNPTFLVDRVHVPTAKHFITESCGGDSMYVASLLGFQHLTVVAQGVAAAGSRRQRWRSRHLHQRVHLAVRSAYSLENLNNHKDEQQLRLSVFCRCPCSVPTRMLSCCSCADIAKDKTALP